VKTSTWLPRPSPSTFRSEQRDDHAEGPHAADDPDKHEALKRMSVIRDGLVVRNLDGSAKSDDQADKAMGASAAALACRFVCSTPCGTRSGLTLRCSA
jgi:hypothetical protein